MNARLDVLQGRDKAPACRTRHPTGRTDAEAGGYGVAKVALQRRTASGSCDATGNVGSCEGPAEERLGLSAQGNTRIQSLKGWF